MTCAGVRIPFQAPLIFFMNSNWLHFSPSSRWFVTGGLLLRVPRTHTCHSSSPPFFGALWPALRQVLCSTTLRTSLRKTHRALTTPAHCPHTHVHKNKAPQSSFISPKRKLRRGAAADKQTNKRRANSSKGSNAVLLTLVQREGESIASAASRQKRNSRLRSSEEAPR